MLSKSPLVLFCLSLALTACAGGGAGPVAEPSWVTTRQHPEYPESRFLVGVGRASGVGRDTAWRQARDRAVADIASQLETHIRSEITTIVRETLRVQGDRREGRSLTEMTNDVRAFSEGSFANIRPVARHYDPANQEGAVLVAISRRDHVKLAQQEVAELDTRLSSLGSEAKKLEDSGRALQAALRLREAERLALERSAVRSRANFVLRGAVADDGPLALGAALAGQRAAVAKVRILISCQHDSSGLQGAASRGRETPSGELEQRFVSAFGDMGLSVVPAGVDPAEAARRWQEPGFLRGLAKDARGQVLLLLITARSSSRALEDPELVRVLSSGTARLIDARTGELIVSAAFSPDAARSAAKIGLARVQSRLEDEALAQLAKELYERVKEKLE